MIKIYCGKQFGRLEVIEKQEERTKSGQIRWKCKCQCGNEIITIAERLRNGQTRSCGCLSKDTARNKREKCIGLVNGTAISKIKSNTARSDSITGVKGVAYAKDKGKYRVCIQLQGKRIHIGYFDTLEEGISARKKAEEIYFKPIIEQYERNDKNAEKTVLC